MAVLNVLLIASFFGIAVMYIVYFVDAIRQSLAQAVLVVLIPFYVVHYAYVKSQRGMPSRLVLVACIIVQFLAAAGRVVMLGGDVT